MFSALAAVCTVYCAIEIVLITLHYIENTVLCLRQNLRNTRALDALLRQYASNDQVVELKMRQTHTDTNSDATAAAAAVSGPVSSYSHVLADL